MLLDGLPHLPLLKAFEHEPSPNVISRALMPTTIVSLRHSFLCLAMIPCFAVSQVSQVSLYTLTGGVLGWDARDRWDTCLPRMIRTPSHYLLCVPAPAVLPVVTIVCHLCAHKEKKPRKRLIAATRGESCLSLQKTLWRQLSSVALMPCLHPTSAP